ncbi:MAG TPA: antibiotic biosynthesis monooxygenase [Stellaceae bacterium]|jgi:quinol monooxygenase YgiN
MRRSTLTIGLVALAIAASGATRAQPAASGLVYAITYFEVSPSAIAHTAVSAGQYAEASGKEPGSAGFEAFEEIGRPSRFATVEAWRDTAAASAHAAAASTHRFADQLRPALVGPFEIRRFDGLSVVAPKAQGERHAVWVLTHVDVFPAGKDQAVGLVKALAEAGRQADGNLRFDVLQQQGHANHFALVEAWANASAFEASLMSAPTRNFRQKLTPLEGALYDERLYRALR